MFGRYRQLLPAHSGAGTGQCRRRGQGLAAGGLVKHRPKGLNRDVECAATALRHVLRGCQNLNQVGVRVVQNTVPVELAQRAVGFEQAHQPLYMAQGGDGFVQCLLCQQSGVVGYLQ